MNNSDITEVEFESEPGTIIVYYSDGNYEKIRGCGLTRLAKMKDYYHKKNELRIRMENELKANVMADSVKTANDANAIEDFANKRLRLHQIIAGLLFIAMLLGLNFPPAIIFVLAASMGTVAGVVAKYCYDSININKKMEELDKYLLYICDQDRIEKASKKRAMETGKEPVSAFNIHKKDYQELEELLEYSDHLEPKVKVKKKQL